MTPLDGSWQLSQLSVPGTHDAGARVEPVRGTTKCQDLSIAEQLAAGVRFLDIRCRHVRDAFTVYHGPIDQHLSFDDVLAAVSGFLDAHPGETVILSIKEESTPDDNTRSFEATFDAYVARQHSRWLLGADLPTLDAARGKIVLFRRFTAASTPKGLDASRFPDDTTFGIGDYLRVQDHYNVANNGTKWGYILALLNEARDGKPGTLYVNFASGTSKGVFGLPNIPAVADDINPRLTAFFDAHPSGRFGTVLMDFADAARCALIYRTNAPTSAAP